MKVLPAVALAALIPYYWMAASRSGVGPWNDDSIYAATAQSLAEGHGYRIPSLPGDPPQTKYPILFPAVLATIWKVYPIFPENLSLLKLVPLLSTAGWLLASRQLIARLADAATGTWIAILTATAPLVITLSSYLLADTLFAMLVTLALVWAHDAQAGSSTGIRGAIVAAVFAALAFHARSTATAAIIAILLILAARRKWLACLSFGLISAALCLPWVAWQRLQDLSSAGIYNSWRSYDTWQVLLHFSAREKAAVIATNAVVLTHCPIIPESLLPFGAAALLSFAFDALLVVGLLAERKLTLAHLFFAIYTAMMLLWAWPPWRFMSALLPLALYFAARGLKRILSWPGTGRLAVAAALAISFAGLTAQVLGARGKEVVPIDSFHTGLNWPAAASAARAAGSLTAPNAVILASADGAVWLYGKRKAVREMDLFSPLELMYLRVPGVVQRRWPDFAAYLFRERVTHIIDGPPIDEVSAIRSGFLRVLDREYPGILSPAVDLGGGYRLLAVDRSRISRLTVSIGPRQSSRHTQTLPPDFSVDPRWR